MGGKNAPRTPEEGASGIVWLATEAPQSLTGKFLSDGKEMRGRPSEEASKAQLG